MRPPVGKHVDWNALDEATQAQLLTRPTRALAAGVRGRVEETMADVAARGDVALRVLTEHYDGVRLDSHEAMRARIVADLSQAASAPVAVAFGLPPLAGADTGAGTGEASGQSLDAIDADFDHYGPPDAGLLQADAGAEVVESLHSDLLKSNCPVTGQPDWASVHLRYRGPRIDRVGLLRYLVGFREHAGFHEQCVEQIFLDLLQRCRPAQLSVEARYTRRGGLDINPWRATPGCTAPPALRDLRQ